MQILAPALYRLGRKMLRRGHCTNETSHPNPFHNKFHTLDFWADCYQQYKTLLASFSPTDDAIQYTTIQISSTVQIMLYVSHIPCVMLFLLIPTTLRH